MAVYLKIDSEDEYMGDNISSLEFNLSKETVSSIWIKFSDKSDNDEMYVSIPNEHLISLAKFILSELS